MPRPMLTGKDAIKAARRGAQLFVWTFNGWVAVELGRVDRRFLWLYGVEQ